MQKAVSLSEGKVSFLDYAKLNRNNKEKRVSYSSPDYFLTNILNACEVCGESIKEMEPKLFSFNSPQDACQNCQGLGYLISFDPKKFIQNPELPIFEGALSVLNPEGNILYTHQGKKQIIQAYELNNLNLKTPWKDLPENFQNQILSGTKEKNSTKRKFNCLDIIEKLYQKYQITNLKKYQITSFCQSCKGSGLNPIALKVTFKDKNIHTYNQMQIKELFHFFKEVDLSKYQEKIWKPILTELNERLFFLMNVGLEYLTLNRRANTLSGGEAQRIRLASQVGSGLEGCLYILDEPSIGLHSLDNEKLIYTLRLLKEKNNSLIVIEHDEDTILASDYLIELGPQAGIHGGEVTFSATPENLKNFLPSKPKKQINYQLEKQATASYLLGAKNIPIPIRRDASSASTFILKDINEFNLKNLTVHFPLEIFTVITGVSGSGKSTLLTVLADRIKQNLALGVLKNQGSETKQKKLSTQLEKIIEIDQKPIGRTPRSNPATYTKMWEPIRDLFSQTKESKVRGYTKGRFSFNVKGGRCEECGGAGIVKIETQIFSPIEVTCEACNGKRFNPSTMDIDYKGKNIHEILEMNFETAEIFFEPIPRVKRICKIINQIGLGYLKLGQPSTTLSGGEAQRIKIASELGRPQQGKTLYLLDEPTTGLHFDDIKKLLDALQKLVNQKNTLVVIEHNLEMIKSADHIIELGPSGGDNGGKLVFTGNYEEIMTTHTLTAQSIKKYHKRQKKRESGFFLKKNNFSELFPKNSQKKQPQDLVSEDTPSIKIQGLKKHNLKNIDLQIPKNQITVFTGVSGSGKTSIALDSIFTEGQRKYLESLSTYARRFLGRVQRPEAEKMENLSPSIAIDQKKISRNPRSIIATQTEIYDSLRVLFANIGHPHCPHCDQPLAQYSETLAARKLISEYPNETILLLAPLYLTHFKHQYLLEKKSDFQKYLSSFREKGYHRFLLDQKLMKIDDMNLTKKIKTTKSIFIVIDRLQTELENEERLIEGIEKAYEIGNGVVGIKRGEKDFFLLTKFYSCRNEIHNLMIKEPLTPRHFSFNHQLGACEVCQGIGETHSLNFNSLILDPGKSILESIDPVALEKVDPSEIKRLFKQVTFLKQNLLEKKFSDLSRKEKKFLYYGIVDSSLIQKKSTISDALNSRPLLENEENWKGFFSLILGLSTSKQSLKQLQTAFYHQPQQIKKHFDHTECFSCWGGRLKPLYNQVKIHGNSLLDLLTMKVPDFFEFFKNLPSVLNKKEKSMSMETIDELVFRTSQLLKLGVGYLTLDRKVETLSGGEMQRIRLSTQIGNQLKDVIYVLDEPTVGLHERDNERLMEVIRSLKHQGNTVLLVEHDTGMIKMADYIVDVGPEAGERGGQIIYAGKNEKAKLKHTSFYSFIFDQNKFRYSRQHFLPFQQKDSYFHFENIFHHNLKNQNIKIPLNRLTAISGVSGSGKSSLLEWIYKQLLRHIQEPALLSKKQKSNSPIYLKYFPKEYKKEKEKIENSSNTPINFPIKKVYLVEQTPVSRNKRSIILSYMEIYDLIREVFKNTKGAKERGYGKGHFSFNSHLGGCSNCQGMGEEIIEMHFISDVTVTCETCRGKRFQKEVLEIYYQGKNINEVLQLTFTEAHEFFYSFKKIRTKIQQLIDSGLGYLKLGFKTSLLSGGELQRLKIAHELAFENPDHTLYLLDEPTTGLHFKDIEKLVLLLEKLVEQGGTVVTIEHNLEFLRSVDHLIELGPEGGDEGGKILGTGTPDEIKKNKIGITSTYL